MTASLHNRHDPSLCHSADCAVILESLGDLLPQQCKNLGVQKHGQQVARHLPANAVSSLLACSGEPQFNALRAHDLGSFPVWCPKARY